MGISVRELKHAAKLQEWSARIAECRGSGIGVKAWCREQGIALKTYYNWERQIVKAATGQYETARSEQSGMLVRVRPDTLPGKDGISIKSVITIQHGETVITLPTGSSAETIAELVKALNHHA